MTEKMRAAARITIMQMEGGHKATDHPSDPGGLTKYGISQRSYPDLDIRSLTYDEAVIIFKLDYWDKIAGDLLPWPLCLYVSDAAFNMGPVRAVRLLQKALGNVNVDGVMGPKTLAATNRYFPGEIGAMFNARRVLAHAAMPHASMYGVGWCNRVFRIVEEAHKYMRENR
jgi:lysozyme family protein